ncbi:MAG: hypothetical protein AB7E80_02190 [Hyphomicrobiaceae bacterium]
MVALTSLVNLTGAAGWVALLAPFAVLLMSIIAALAGRRRSTGSAGVTAAPREAGVAPPVQPAPLGRPSPVEPGTVDQGAVSPGDMSDAASMPPVPEPEAGAAEPLAAPPPAPTLPELEIAIQEAEEREDDVEVAKLCIAFAKGARAKGDGRGVISTHLIRAIQLSMRAGHDQTHALARLEFGDFLASEGDTMSACEHWQIARRIYWGEQDRARIADMDKRMTAIGCPTDWVLTGF